MLDDENLEFSAHSVTNRMWKLPQIDQAKLIQLQSLGNITDLVIRILLNRGIDTIEKASAFLSPEFITSMPDPSLLNDVDIAIDRIVAYLNNNEKICVWGDYDVDGTVSVALFVRFLRTIGYHNILSYIPDRLSEGYGLNSAGLKKLKDQGVSLVIAVDCGTSNSEAIGFASSNGIETIVIDHHKVCDVAGPGSFAFINPHRHDQVNQSFKELCAAGLVFLVLVALNRKLHSENFYHSKSIQKPNLKEYLGMVSLATVCDVMCLVGLNRVYVFHGLRMLNKQKDKHLVCLAKAAGIENIENAGHLGFVLGPRINAAGRVGDSSSLAVDFFTCEDDCKMCSYAAKLNQINIQRQSIENQNLEFAEEEVKGIDLESKYLLISGEKMHPGVIGIVAGRLKEKYNKPAFVISLNEEVCKGSVRSVEGVDVGRLVQNAVNKGILIGGGGHKMAAGFSVLANSIGEFKKFLDDTFKNIEFSEPTVLVDGILALSAINSNLFSDISKLEPFGVGNPAPRFIFPRLLVVRVNVLKEKHIKCTLADEAGKVIDGYLFNGMGTDLGRYILSLSIGRRINILGVAKSDVWKGREQVKILIEDLASA